MNNQDPIVSLARLRVIRLSAELEATLSEKQWSGPTLEILQRLKERAAESLASLAIADPEKPSEIRTLQNEVKRYDEWLTWMKEIISEGKAYDQSLKEDEREDMLDFLSQTQEGREQLVELGMIDDIQSD